MGEVGEYRTFKAEAICAQKLFLCHFHLRRESWRRNTKEKNLYNNGHMRALIYKVYERNMGKENMFNISFLIPVDLQIRVGEAKPKTMQLIT